jgi:hypothetical protein
MVIFRLYIGDLVVAASLAVAAETAKPAQPAQPANPAPDEQPATEAAEASAVQGLAPGSPEWVAREYLMAVRERGFSAEADFLHPDQMERFKAILIPVFAAESQDGGRALMNATFGRDARMTEVRVADPADFLRRFARVMAVRVPDQPTDFDRLSVLGSVKEGERVHVLTRLSTGSGKSAKERLEVVSLAPSERGWKLMLSPKLEAAVRAMDRRGGDTRSAPRLVPRPPPPEPPPRPLHAEKPSGQRQGAPRPQ